MLHAVSLSYVVWARLRRHTLRFIMPSLRLNTPTRRQAADWPAIEYATILRIYDEFSALR